MKAARTIALGSWTTSGKGSPFRKNSGWPPMGRTDQRTEQPVTAQDVFRSLDPLSHPARVEVLMLLSERRPQLHRGEQEIEPQDRPSTVPHEVPLGRRLCEPKGQPRPVLVDQAGLDRAGVGNGNGPASEGLIRTASSLGSSRRTVSPSPHRYPTSFPERIRPSWTGNRPDRTGASPSRRTPFPASSPTPP